MMYKFSKKSLERLNTVHPDLMKVMLMSIEDSPYDFGITEGIRTEERQKELYSQRKSLTLNSRHLTGHAVDIAVWVEGEVTWEGKYYEEVAKHILTTAQTLNVPVNWGGMWKKLKDSPHFELSRKEYP